MVGSGRRAYRDVAGSLADPAAGEQQADPFSALAAILPTLPGLAAGSNVRLIEGLDGILHSNTAVAQEISSLANEVKILNDRNLTMFGQQASSVAPDLPMDQGALVSAFKQAITESAQSLQQAAGPLSLPPGAAIAPPVAAGPTATPTAPGAAGPTTVTSPSGRVPSPLSSAPATPSTTRLAGGVPDVNEGEPAQQADGPSPGATAYADFQRARDYFGGKSGFSMANMRQDLGAKMVDRLDNATWGEQLVQDGTGIYHHPSDVEGELGDIASSGDVASFLRRDKMLGVARQASGTLAEGGSMGEAGVGMLGSTGAKALGAGAAVVMGLKQGADFFEKQRAANNEWVSQTGGSQTDALINRAKGQIFDFMHQGVLSQEDSDTLYKGVAKVGLKGDEATNAQNFAISNYQDLAMSVSQSLDIVSFAAAHNQETLVGLSGSLRAVSKSAADAGVNTEKARTQFVANWESFSQVFSGGTATSLAQGMSSATNAMGPEFQDVDTSGALSGDPLAMMAAQNGMETNQVIGMGMENGGDVKIAGMLDKYQKDKAEQQLSGEAVQLIKDRYANRADQSKPDFSDAELNDLKHDLLINPDYGVPDIDNTLPGIIQQETGVLYEPQQALTWLIDKVAGVGTVQGEVEKQSTSDSTTTVPVGGGDPTNLDTSSGTLPGYESVSFVAGSSPEFTKATENVDMFGNPVGRAFGQDAAQNGRVGGISQYLAAEGNATGIDTVTVQADGGPLTVSLADAMLHFRDQIDRGTATIAEGDNKGSTVASATGVAGDTSVPLTSDNVDRTTLQDPDGSSSSGSTATGGVTITPTPWLMRMFNFQTSGSIFDPFAVRAPGSTDPTPDGRNAGH